MSVTKSIPVHSTYVILWQNTEEDRLLCYENYVVVSILRTINWNSAARLLGKRDGFHHEASRNLIHTPSTFRVRGNVYRLSSCIGLSTVVYHIGKIPGPSRTGGITGICASVWICLRLPVIVFFTSRDGRAFSQKKKVRKHKNDIDVRIVHRLS